MTGSRICPICKRPLPEGAEAARFRPFCSKRCADIDLGRWLKGTYAIPAVESEAETESEAGAEDAGDGKAPRPRKH
jgi:endogenous inhibitor of DNA gyrase (YacG/DUF329 family)